MRKLLSLAIVGLVLVGGTFATGGAEEEDGVTSVVVPSYRTGEDVGARFFVPQVERFNEEYEGRFEIILEESPSNTHTERIRQLALQNELPAVFQVSDSAWVEDFLIANDRLQDLSDWLDENTALRDRFIRDSLEFVTKEDGGVYALPLSVLKPTGLYYNSEKIQPENGIAALSWEEFSELLGDNTISYQTAEGGWTVSLMLAAIMGSLEGGKEILETGVQEAKITDFTSDTWVEAFTILQNSFEANGWNGAIGATYPDAANAFYANETAVLADGTWIIDKVNDPTDWANGFDGADVVGDYYPGNVAIANPNVYDWMIPAGLPEDELELALAFFEFMNRPEEIEQFILAEGGTAPGIVYSEEFEDALSENNLLSDFASAANAETTYVPYFHDSINASLFTGEFSNYLVNLYNGSWTPEEFAEELTAAAQR